MVREQKSTQIRSAIQTGKTHGMCLMEQSLNELVQANVITLQEALRYAEDPKLITS
jgi:Tfp pilus assembly pilus retraction ATPase PilT